MDEMEPIDLLPTHYIISELQKRFDDFILVAAQNKTESFDDITMCFRGSFHGVMGLCSLANLAIEAGMGEEQNE